MNLRMHFRPGLGALLAFVVVAGLSAAAPAAAQETAPDTTAADTTVTDATAADTTQAPPRRTVPPADTARADTARADTARADSSALRSPSGAGPGEAAGDAVQFSARDSLVIVFDEEEGDVGTLYGDAEITRKDITLNAYQVDILLERDELHATGLPVDTGTVGLPRFQRGESEAFTGRELAFNLGTERGRVVEARTGFQEGYVEGEVVKTYSDRTQFVRDGQYTTCNCPRDETPSYSLRSNKMKVQGKWVYTGPIQLFIFNIPTPLILPFAFLPNTGGRRSGLLPPEYGDDQDRGFFLKHFGYYWAFNDYLGLQLTGGLWSRGSWQVRPQLDYRRRYRYNGNLDVDYVRNIVGDVVDDDYVNRTTTSIRWNHSQQFNPTTSLRSNVRLSSESYLRGISENFDDNVTQRTSSSVNFSKSWAQGARDLDVTLNQNQNFSSGNVNLTLPSLSFSQQRFKPFERDRREPGQEERWYERISFQYDGDLDNRYDFAPLPDSTLANRGATGIAWYDALLSSSKHERATGEEQRFDFSATHSIPVNATFTLDRYDLNLTPRLSYDAEWFINTRRLAVQRDTTFAGTDSMEVESSVVTRNEPGFFSARDFNFGVGANTTFYGLFPFRVGPFSGLRHTVQPSLSFNFAPNVYDDFFGRTRTYTDPETGEEVRYDITTGNRVRGSTAQRSLNFSIDNVFETKRVRIDSTGAEQTETLQMLRVDASSRYNFAADSLRLSDIDVGLRSPALRRLGINARANFTFSPFVFGDNGRVNRLVIGEPGLRLARLTRFRLSVNTSFQGGGNAGGLGNGGLAGGDFAGGDLAGGSVPPVPEPAGDDLSGIGSYGSTLGRYADFSIPWSLDLGFTYSLRNTATFSQRAILNADFSLNLTPRWKVSGTSGYDFDVGEVTATRLRILRDFECWQMSFNWTPFGPRQSYAFSLHVKSGALSDLLNLRLPRSGVSDRFGNLIPRQ